MKQVYKVLLIGWIVIGSFDALGSIASKQFNFNYAFLALISLIIYCVFGFWATKGKNLQTGVIVAAAIGFFDSTIGWEISMLLKANTGNLNNDPTISVWLITIILVTGLAALCGLIGGGLATIINRRKAKQYR